MMDLLIKLIIENFGTGLVSLAVIGLVVYGSKIARPGLVQADANAALYGQLKAQIEALHAEVRLLKRQQVILERLALKAGIDVEAAYREAGLYEEKDAK